MVFAYTSEVEGLAQVSSQVRKKLVKKAEEGSESVAVCHFRMVVVVI